eukprot:GHVL01019480.1.p1 GENE.GHVL01019480.1~~GHVL01019480.1.p1  ORF type:complete len:1349 (+),score=302.46 GHVL01019480.1:570-4049(+)
MMLHTDHHSKDVKNKMTKDAFVSNNRGINNGSDLPREYQEALYERITSKEITIHEDDMERFRQQSAGAHGRRRFELFLKESEGLVSSSTEAIKKKEKNKVNREYLVASKLLVGHFRPLFEAAAWPLLASLSVILEDCDYPKVVNPAILGFRYCVEIASKFGLATEREAFIGALSKFTLLSNCGKEMGEKNVLCCKALLEIGINEGDRLEASWRHVLNCISQLDRLQLLKNAQFQSSPDMSAGRRVTSAIGLLAGSSDNRHLIDTHNSEAVTSQIDVSSMDVLFARSVSLSSDAVVHLVFHLCESSKQELASVEAPRIYSLQKLVEVADFNMGRIRFVWTKIWGILANRFEEAALHPNIKVAQFAIDSLRQLATKFLEKEELNNFHFQSEFFRPFETVMTSSTSDPIILEYLIQVLDNLVRSRARNIKSGWHSIWRVLYSAATKKKLNVYNTAFNLITYIMENDTILPLIACENLTDCVECLVEFGRSQYDINICVRAVDYLVVVASILADPNITKPSNRPTVKHLTSLQLQTASIPSVNNINVPTIDSISPTPPIDSISPTPPIDSISPTPPIDSNAPVLQFDSISPAPPSLRWFPVLTALAQLISDPRREIRDRCLAGLFDSLDIYGPLEFDSEAWRLVFKGVLVPLFDDLNINQENEQLMKHVVSQSGSFTPTHQSIRSSGNPTSPKPIKTCIPGPSEVYLAALNQLIRFVDKHFTSIGFLMSDVLKLLRGCILQKSEQIARVGVVGLKQLLTQVGARCDSDIWEVILTNICSIIQACTPYQLLCEEPGHEANTTLSRTWSGSPSGHAPYGHDENRASERDSIDVSNQAGCSTVDVSETAESLRCARGGDETAESLRCATEKDETAESLQCATGKDETAESLRCATGKDETAESLQCATGKVETAESLRCARGDEWLPPCLPNELPFDSQKVVTKCVVQLQLIDMIQELMIGRSVVCYPPSNTYFLNIPINSLITLSESMHSSASFARAFNRKVELRRLLKLAGFMADMRQLPGLLKQERESLSSFVCMLFLLNGDPRSEGRLKDVLLESTKRIVLTYLNKDRELKECLRGPRNGTIFHIELEREVNGLVPTICILLQGFLSMKTDAFNHCLPVVFPLLADLLLCESIKVRQELRQLLLKSVCPILGCQTPPPPNHR